MNYSFPTGSNIWVKYISENGKVINHAAKVVATAETDSILVQYNPQKTREVVNVRNCFLMEETPLLRRNKVSDRNNAALSYTDQSKYLDTSNRRGRKARNHASFRSEQSKNPVTSNRSQSNGLNDAAITTTNQTMYLDTSYTRRRKARNHAAYAGGKINRKKEKMNVVGLDNKKLSSYLAAYAGRQENYNKKNERMNVVGLDNEKLSSYLDCSSVIPKGWKVKNFPRKNRKVEDRLWYTSTNKKLQSKIEVQMFLNVLDVSDGNEEIAWHLFLWFRKQPDLWQKAKKFCAVQLIKFNEHDDSDEETIVDEDYDFIKKYLIQIKSKG